MTKLFIVPTPIGNLKDISLRAIEVLNEVDLILAEDTRTSGKLMQHYNIGTPLQSHHMHNEHSTLPQIIQQLKQEPQRFLTLGFYWSEKRCPMTLQLNVYLEPLLLCLHLC